MRVIHKSRRDVGTLKIKIFKKYDLRVIVSFVIFQIQLINSHNNLTLIPINF